MPPAADPEGTVRSPVPGIVASVQVAPGDAVVAGGTLVVVESMKMEYPVDAPHDGTVDHVAVAVGAQVATGAVLARLTSTPSGEDDTATPDTATPDTATPDTATADPLEERGGALRDDLAAVLDRHRRTTDAARPAAVARRRERGQRTARENVEDLVDEGSFVEYGPLLLAAQRSRRGLDELVERTPADGLVAGIGRVDGRPVAVLAYDATVLAGTQGHFNHRKKDRLFEIVEQRGLPVVFFTEGGGGRPGDTDVPIVSGLDVMAFHLFARLSGSVPLVGIASGRCFAGNAALLGCCDVVIATEGTNIGMGGPAMVEGGGLGAFTPEQIGPLDEQVANGVVDVDVPDEAAAVEVARRYLDLVADPSRVIPATAPPTSAMRDVVPESRRRGYDVHDAIEAVVDSGSLLELRPDWAPGMVTALARCEGRSIAIVANNPMHLGGAIDADGADKAARFLQLCDAHGLPVLFLCDTPGFMVGPEAERAATVRHVSRMFVVGANLRVPIGTLILRKAYGLGAMAMAGGSFRVPRFVVAWPTGELGGMGLEGAVRLGFRDELAAEPDETARDRLFDRLVAAAYENGAALNTATIGEIDDVIDPAETRRWIALLGDEVGGDHPARRGFIDTW